MTEPPVWTREQLEIDRLKAIELFRKERMEEPLEDYLEAFDEYQGHIEELLETTVDLSQLESTALDVLTDPHLLEAFRYLAAPPISQGDLKVLAEATSLYNLHNLLDAQDRGLSLFWAHDLAPLTAWIEQTKS